MRLALLFTVLVLTGGAFAAMNGARAHGGVAHGSEAETEAHLEAAPDAPPGEDAGPGLPFPVDLEVRFDLIDHTGARRSESDFAGRPMAIFFGYANCEAICSVALPRIGAALDLLAERGASLAPILITVDPVRDTPRAMAAALAQIHPGLIGLTGSPDELAAARAAFQVETSQVTADIEGAPIFAHGSMIYLIDARGELQSVVPPILGPDRIAEIMEQRLFPAN